LNVTADSKPKGNNIIIDNPRLHGLVLQPHPRSNVT
jgi:hypothetical protein